jgi:hypothetical protein
VMVSRRKERRRYLVCVGIYVDDFRVVASKSHMLYKLEWAEIADPKEQALKLSCLYS